MLMPKKVKFRKQQRGRRRGKAQKGSSISFGDYGLKAMEELQELKPNKETATNAMVMFLAINTSSVQLILPAIVVALMGATASARRDAGPRSGCGLPLRT